MALARIEIAENGANVRFPPIAEIAPSADSAPVKRAIATLLFLACGCSRAQHTFEVDVGDSNVTSAVVFLCDGRAETELQRVRHLFQGSLATNCEGSGRVRLVYAEGTVVDCPVGYVTRMDDHWRFRARDGRCDYPRDGATPP